MLYAQGGLTIGRSVSMGPGCVISTGGHVFDEPGSIRAQGFTKAPIEIGDGVWLGANATVTEGVTIGDDAIVAAGAVRRRRRAARRDRRRRPGPGAALPARLRAAGLARGGLLGRPGSAAARA